MCLDYSSNMLGTGKMGCKKCCDDQVRASRRCCSFLHSSYRLLLVILILNQYHGLELGAAQCCLVVNADYHDTMATIARQSFLISKVWLLGHVLWCCCGV